MFHHDVLLELSKLNELHHLFTVILGVESSGLCFHQCRLV
jgi:hypothetical protein